ncbi:hypothetical protein K470DRAFT_156911 [Piedraia hortae CBS 480.64]|uniref:Uncharacterized protein n=1 Tax=Piedraia hortae CBS 480.64 TaxID=1314780 RepID=A0A6A7BSZ5_9PEZI|nr:hypothetical protein K470DRAFT_156911 [Piedraia hortae CBS 480.64]
MAILTSLWGAGGGLRGGGGLSFDRRAKSDVVGEVSRGNYDGGYECCDDAPPAYGLVCDDAPPPYDPKIDWEDVRVRERKGKGGGKAKRGGQNQGNGGGGNKKKNDDRGDDGEGEKGTGGGDAAGGAGDPPGGGGNDPSPPPNAGGAKKKKKSKKAQWDPDDDEKKDEEFDPLANWDENETAEAENDVSTTEPTNQPEDDAFLGLGATGKKKKRKNKVGRVIIESTAKLTFARMIPPRHPTQSTT